MPVHARRNRAGHCRCSLTSMRQPFRLSCMLPSTEPPQPDAIGPHTGIGPTAGGRGSQVAELLRVGILSGEYLPGAPLREVILAERYSASRRTIREALLELSSQGLVSHRHNQGATVRQFEADAISDLYRVRRVLENEGARSSTVAPDGRLAAVTRALNNISMSAQNRRPSAELGAAD